MWGRRRNGLTNNFTLAVYMQFLVAADILACYAEMYALPQEEISLIVFGLDEAGTVKALRTFTVPPSGATATLHALLHDLKIQNPQRTKTYFQPLADFLNQFLLGVRLQPVTLVVSDGQSDGRAHAKRGLTPPPDIPFESFGKRGIYSAPGVQGWRVAIAGGGGLDLTALFQKPMVPPTKKSQATAPQDSVIDPCLIDPDLVVETGERIVLWPHWNPFSGVAQGILSVWVGHTCVARFGAFTVELRHGNETLPVGRVAQTLIDQHPRRFTFPVAARGAAPAEAVVQVSLDRGSTTRTIYPHKPSVVTLEKVSYFSAFWRHIVVALLLLVTVCIVLPPAVRRVAAFIQQYRGKQRNRPEVIKVLGGPVVPLLRDQPVPIGAGCPIAAPGMPRGVVLAVATWTGIRGVLTLRPGDGVRMRVNGVEVDGEAAYCLGQPLQFINAADGTTYDVTLYPGSSSDIGFGTPLAVNESRPDRTEGFSGLGASFGTEAFGAITGTSSGDRANPGAYI